jgi:hypothetical protein
VHAGQLGIVLFGNLHAVPLAQLHDDVEEVHAIQFELFAERHILFQMADVFIGSDVREDIGYCFANFFTSHAFFPSFLSSLAAATAGPTANVRDQPSRALR